jgi:hypothetical protein
MRKQTDWLPTTRTGQLAMANDWIEVCNPQKTTWEIPQIALLGLTNYRDAATNESNRTPECPCGGENQQGFHPFAGFIPSYS